MTKLILNDCLQALKELPDSSVDSIVTDPPAGIAFMGKEWDKNKGGRDNWIKWMEEVATECKRVLKPGGHAFVWAIPRTSHWTATAWENAGFEIRDVVAHVFGSGFPKSLNIGKSVDKLLGNEREVVGKDRSGSERKCMTGDFIGGEYGITKGSSPYEGWGTTLKPAREDWILMRKPLSEKTVAENCLKWGTGGINIDESRVETKDSYKANGMKSLGVMHDDNWKPREITQEMHNQGRFPANLIHDNSEEVRECFPETKSEKFKSGTKRQPRTGREQYGDMEQSHSGIDSFGDSGNASRFFKSIIYNPKASKAERNRGCEELEETIGGGMAGTQDQSLLTGSGNIRNNITKNNHPTVKPIALMEYLIKMITPPSGTVLDPFMGSGSTGVAAIKNGFDFIGIDMTPEYIEIAKARIEHAKKEQKKYLI